MSAPIVQSWAVEEKRLASLSAGGRCCLCGSETDLVRAGEGVLMCRHCRDHTTSVGSITGMDGEPIFWWNCICKESGSDFKTRDSALKAAQRHEKEAA